MVVPETLRDNRSSDIKGKGSVGKPKRLSNRTTNAPSDVSEKPVMAGRARLKKPTNEQSGEENKRYGRTPYQGQHHTCGFFRCDICENAWFSANSWADCYQICNGCNRGIYPHIQVQRKKKKFKSRKKEMKKHPEDKCQKCMELGHSCVEVASSPKKGKKGKRRKKRKDKESHKREE